MAIRILIKNDVNTFSNKLYYNKLFFIYKH